MKLFLPWLKPYWKEIALLFFILHCLSGLRAQSSGPFKLLVQWKDQMPANSQTLPFKAQYSDTLSVQQAISSVLGELQVRGYLTASLEELVWQGRNVQAIFSVGNQYKWVNLRIGTLLKGVLSRNGFKKLPENGSVVNLKVFDAIRKIAIRHAENQGYPFASVFLDSLSLYNNEIAAIMRYRTGPRIYFDSLVIVGDVNISKQYLESYLKLKRPSPFKGEASYVLYREELVLQAARVLVGLPFLEQTRPPEIFFELGKAHLKLFLKERKASTLDGAIGLSPNNARNGRLLLTGQFDLNLHNPFGRGKKLFAKWQRIKEASPAYHFEYTHPDIFRAGFDLFLKLQSLKEDSTYFNLLWHSGLNFRLGSGHELLLFYEQNRSNNLNNGDMVQALPSGRLGTLPALLPGRARARFNAYGINYRYRTTDRPIMPRKGMLVNIEGKLGQKSFSLDDDVSDSVNNALALQANQLVASSSLQAYIPINSNISLLLQNRSGNIFNGALYAPDLFRLGGLNTLRGFDENIFFSSLYSINTIECRLYFERRSAFFVFLDQGYLSDKSLEQPAISWPLGTGTGISLQTKGGLLTLIYAVGQTEGQDFQFQNAKIHFRFMNIF